MLDINQSLSSGLGKKAFVPTQSPTVGNVSPDSTISNHQISAAPERRFIGKRTRLSLPVLRPDVLVRKYWRIKRMKDSIRPFICGKSCAFCFYGTSWRQFERALGIAVECASRFNVLGLDFGFHCPSLPSLPSLKVDDPVPHFSGKGKTLAHTGWPTDVSVLFFRDMSVHDQFTSPDGAWFTLTRSEPRTSIWWGGGGNSR